MHFLYSTQCWHRLCSWCYGMNDCIFVELGESIHSRCMYVCCVLEGHSDCCMETVHKRARSSAVRKCWDNWGWRRRLSEDGSNGDEERRWLVTILFMDYTTGFSIIHIWYLMLHYLIFLSSKATWISDIFNCSLSKWLLQIWYDRTPALRRHKGREREAHGKMSTMY